MNSDWPLVSIDEIKAESKGSIAIGPFGSRMKSDCYVERGVAVIRGTNITAGLKFGGDFVYITKEKASTLGSSNVYKNDLVFPHRGSIGQVGIVIEDEHFVLSSSLMKLTCDTKKANPKFIYYFFRSRLGRHELLKNSSQVGTPGIGQPLTSLRGIEFRLPPLEVQNTVVETLSSLDKKIELNRQTNQTLEHIAQAIFKSWFVDFDPTRAKIAAQQAGQDPERAAMAAIAGKSTDELDQLAPAQQQQLKTTAALFPDALVDSELGEIPEGWGFGELKNIAEFTKERVNTSELTLETYVSTENMLEGKKGISTASSLPSVKTTPKFIANQILISNIRPYFMKIWLARFEGGRSNDVLGISAKKLPSTLYLYNLLYQDEFFNFMMTTSKGAKMPRGDKDAIMSWICAQPPEKIQEAYSSAIGEFYELININQKENKILEGTRDSLLPQLLSGELSPSHTKTLA